jgi:hypothetical protein
MAELHLTSEGFELTIAYAGGTIDYGNPLIASCLQALSAANAAVPLNRVSFAEDAPGPPPTYVLRVKTVDDRIWKQWHTFATPTDENPLTTFAVNDAWRPSEYGGHRAMRDLVIALHREIGATSIVAEWT